MRLIVSYLRQYLYDVNKPILAFTVLITVVLIYVNYHWGVDDIISDSNSFLSRFGYRYIIYLVAFIIPYLLLALFTKENPFIYKNFLLLLLLAPAIFSIKTALSLNFNFTDDYIQNYYWQTVIYWPLLCVILIIILLITWKVFHSDQQFYGIKTKVIDWKPYWLMLLIMLPLIAAASTQKDFLAMYPKMKMIAGLDQFNQFGFWEKLLFEISYGSDFISIELFFRGFLILGFIKWAGKDVILPMALFYCTIHFGKPLGECISSFFGGVLLGVVVYHTRSIFGGLIVHLGIAWLMELGGHIGNQLFIHP